MQSQAGPLNCVSTGHFTLHIIMKPDEQIVSFHAPNVALFTAEYQVYKFVLKEDIKFILSPGDVH